MFELSHGALTLILGYAAGLVTAWLTHPIFCSYRKTLFGDGWRSAVIGPAVNRAEGVSAGSCEGHGAFGREAGLRPIEMNDCTVTILSNPAKGEDKSRSAER